MPSTQLYENCLLCMLAIRICLSEWLIFPSLVSSSSFCAWSFRVCRRRHVRRSVMRGPIGFYFIYSQCIKMIRFKYIVTQTQPASKQNRWWKKYYTQTEREREMIRTEDFESTRQIRDTSNQLFTFEWIVASADAVAANAVLCCAFAMHANSIYRLNSWTKVENNHGCSESVWPKPFCVVVGFFLCMLLFRQCVFVFRRLIHHHHC